MSVTLMTRVWDDGPHDRSQAQVLAMIANYANDTDGRAFPAVDTIARRCRIDRSTVKRSLKELERDGWLIITRGGGRKSGRYGRTSHYQLNLDRFEKGGTTHPLEGDQRVHHAPTKGASRPNKGCATHPEPKGTKDNHQDAPEVTFEDFWERCPNQRSRQKAQLAFGALEPAERAEAVEHVAAFYANWEREKPDLERLNPITYLENRRWRDVPKKTSEDPAGRAEALIGWAQKINGNGYLAPGAPGRIIGAELVANGLVTPERLHERCGIFLGPS